VRKLIPAVFSILLCVCSERASQFGPGLAPEEADRVTREREAQERLKRTAGLTELKRRLSGATAATEYRVVSQFNGDFPKFKDSERKYKSYPLIGQRSPRGAIVP
jgi:hypothetical protein